jgi:imidazolonepropionase-like amidohydrolase
LTIPGGQFPEAIDALWVNAHLAIMTQGVPYGAMKDGALAVSKGKIAWVGEKKPYPRILNPEPPKFTTGRGAGSPKGW